MQYRNETKKASKLRSRILGFVIRKPVHSGLAALFLFISFGVGSNFVWGMINKPQVELPAVTVQTGEYGQIPGWWLQEHFEASACSVEICDYNHDADLDGLTNGQEFYYKSDPLDPDTNNNDVSDGDMVSQGFDPSRPGKVTFEEISSEENILGESLVFNHDVEQMLQEEMDISRVNIELVPDSRLTIITTPSVNDYENYATDMNYAINQHFPSESLEYALTAIESGNAQDLESISGNAMSLYVSLLQMPVPIEALMFHKYNIAFYKNLADLIATDAFASNIGTDNAYGDLWYDKAESLFAIIQKINFEWQRLAKL